MRVNSPVIGVLGLGRMGLPIALRLRETGHEVVAFDVSIDRMTALADAGLTLMPSAVELVRAAELLVTVLPGPGELDQAMDGPSGLLSALPAGAAWVDLTSNDPEVARRLAEAAAARCVAAVFSPMGGGPTAAADGTLKFFVGGATPDVARVSGILGDLGGVGALDHIGEDPGAGCAAKLIANLLWFGQVVAVTEALLLGASLGIPPRRLKATLETSSGSSVFIEEYLDRLLEGDYLETFGIDRCVEELETLVRLADQAGVPFELSRSVTDAHRAALARFGAIDGELLAAKLLELRAHQKLSTFEG